MGDLAYQRWWTVHALNGERLMVRAATSPDAKRRAERIWRAGRVQPCLSVTARQSRDDEVVEHITSMNALGFAIPRGAFSELP